MTRVFCLGSSLGKDRVGWDIGAALEQRLAGRSRTDVRVQICPTPAHLPGMLQGATQVLIIDALAGAPVGAVRSVAAEELQRAPNWSTHGVDLVLALNLARALGELPADVRIIGIGVGDPASASDIQSADYAAQVLPAVWAKLTKVLGPL